MSHDYETSKKVAVKIITILAIITIVEVCFTLFAKGYIIDGFHMPVWLLGGVMITMSVVKAYLIIFEFMHMKYEIPGLAKTVLLPLFLLVWGIIAFLWEGNYWNNSRAGLADKDKQERKVSSPVGMQIYDLKSEDLH